MDSLYEQLAPLIGHVVIEHGNLEGDAGKMLARLNGKGDDLSAAQYAAKCPYSDKIKKATKLVAEKITDSDLRTEFENVLAEMDRLRKERNNYIHSEYMPELDQHDNILGAYYRQIEQMGDVVDITDPNSKIAVHRFEMAEIEQIIEDMIVLGLRIRAVSEKYFDTLPYEPPKPPDP